MRIKYCALLFLAAMVGAQAVQPMPPTIAASLIVVGGGSGAASEEPAAAGTNAARISAIMDGRTAPFSYNTPADPVATNPCSASSAAEFDACVVSGNIITVTGSFTGNVTLDASDIDVVMDNAYTIDGSLTLGGGSYAERLRWTGGNVGKIIGIRFRDVLFDDLYALAYSRTVGEVIEHNFSSGWDGSGNPAFARLALINSTLELDGSPDQAEGDKRWAFHNAASYENTDLILANVKLLSNHQNNRFQRITRFVVVDSVFNPDGASNNGMRIHQNADDVWIRDSWSRELWKLDAAGVEAGPSVTDLLTDNYDRYVEEVPFTYALHGSMSNTGTIQNSTLFGGTMTYSPLTDGGGNSSDTWDGTTVPDYSGIGAIR